MPERLWLGAALAAYALAALAPARWRVARPMLALAVVLHSAALATRWQALGHGPFTTLYEILSSSLWSLSLVYLLAWWRWPDLQAGWRPAAAVLALLAVWLLGADARPGHFPPTYDTPLLYLHTLVGKLFLGLLLAATVLALAAARRGEARLDALAHGFAGFAFVAESLMLVVGAVWAQDAWGRYWDWDPLETWAFATWVALAATLHARITLRPRPALHAAWLAGVFTIAFLTFFGVPFLSVAPHKGAI